MSNDIDYIALHEIMTMTRIYGSFPIIVDCLGIHDISQMYWEILVMCILLSGYLTWLIRPSFLESLSN